MENYLTRKNVNKNGGDYLNGKPLDLERRRDIIERYKNGEKVTAIAAELKVTHGVVSKIVKHYNKTGSYLPKKRSNPVERKAAKRKAVPFSVDTILEGTASEPKKPRNLFAPEQLAVLENYFAANPFLDADIKKEIMEKTKLTEKEITTWFTNKRCRLRRQLNDTSSSSATSDSSFSSINSTSSSNLSTDSIPSSYLPSSSFSTSEQNVFAIPSLPPPLPTISIPDARPIVNILNQPYLLPPPLPSQQIQPIPLQLQSQQPQLKLPQQQSQQLQGVQKKGRRPCNFRTVGAVNLIICGLVLPYSVSIFTIISPLESFRFGRYEPAKLKKYRFSTLS